MIYRFQHPKTKEVREIEQPMTAKHEYFGGKGEKKVSWNRIWESPDLLSDTRVDPFDSRKYVEKTASQKGTFADLRDQSAEASEKRASIYGGEDPVKRKYLDNWSKERNGLRHPHDPIKKPFKSQKDSIQERLEKRKNNV